MHILFRTDASLEIGTGHVMRCLTLAEALKERGASCAFVSRTHLGHLNDVIKERGFTIFALPLAQDQGNISSDHPVSDLKHASWLGTSWEKDAEQTLEAIKHTFYDWVIVDHYAIDARWEKRLRSKCKKIMVIDDLADRSHDCNLLLNQNLGFDASQYVERVPSQCRFLIGPMYALLRPEFAQLRSYSLQRRTESLRLKNILITMGGIDKDNVTGKVLQALESTPLPKDCKMTVVMGRNAPWIDHVRDSASQLSWATEVLAHVSNMAQLMAESDLVIGAAGSTSWERCCLGVPSITVVLSDNQKLIAQGIADEYVEYVVKLDAMVEPIHDLIKKIHEDPSLLKHMSASSSKRTEGHGACLIASFLLDRA